MDPQLQTLRFWHDLITVYALLLGVEGPVLLWVGTFLERPRRERALSLVPVLGFAWGAWSAKLINDAQVHAASLISWSLAHYPTFPVPASDTTAAVESATRTGWLFGAVATLLLIAGWALVLRWSRGQGLPALVPRLSSRSDSLGYPSDRTAGAPSTTPVRQPTIATGALDDNADEGIEITVEPLEK